MQVITWTSAASSDISNYTKLGAAPSAVSGKEKLRAFCTSADSSGTATIELALVRESPSQLVIARFPGTATITARRAGTDGSSGDYICDMVWDESGDSFADIVGAVPRGGQGEKYEWYVGVTAFGTANDVTIYLETTERT